MARGLAPRSARAGGPGPNFDARVTGKNRGREMPWTAPTRQKAGLATQRWRVRRGGPGGGGCLRLPGRPRIARRCHHAHRSLVGMKPGPGRGVKGGRRGRHPGARLCLTRVGGSGPVKGAVSHLEFFGASRERSGGFFFDSLSPGFAPRRVAGATSAWALVKGAASRDRKRSFACGSPHDSALCARVNSDKSST